MTLVEFLKARLNEDEAVASAASAGPWGVYKGRPGIRGVERLPHGVTLPGEGSGSLVSIAAHSWLDAAHIARHDPARVLAEVEAKRRILDTLLGEGGERMFEDVFRLLALPYADHPDYRQEWAAS